MTMRRSLAGLFLTMLLAAGCSIDATTELEVGGTPATDPTTDDDGTGDTADGTDDDDGTADPGEGTDADGTDDDGTTDTGTDDDDGTADPGEGTDDGESEQPPPASTPEPPIEPPPPDDDGDVDTGIPTNPEITELIVESFVDIGFTRDEAECLADQLDFEEFDAGSTEILQVFEDCGISLSRLAEIGG